MKAQKYVSIVANDFGHLDKAVNQKLGEGWELYGSPVAGVRIKKETKKEEFYVSQPMVKAE